MPIPINSPKLRGLIAHIFAKANSPREMLSEKAAKRVEMELTGEAVVGENPVLEGPLVTLHDPDPLLLAVYRHMVEQHEKNLASFKGFTTAIMEEIIKQAPKHGMPSTMIPQYVHVFGGRLVALIPQLLAMGLKVEHKHRNKGSYFEISWVDGRPQNESDDGDPSPSPPSSSSRAFSK